MGSNCSALASAEASFRQDREGWRPQRMLTTSGSRSSKDSTLLGLRERLTSRQINSAELPSQILCI